MVKNIFFLSEKYNLDILILIYMRTLECLFLVFDILANIVQNEWFRALTIYLPSSNIEFKMLWMMDQGSFWIKIMSNSLLFSSKMSIRSLFLQTFCEKMFRILKIIFYPCLQLSWLGFLWVLMTSCCAIHNWTYVSRIDNYNCLSSGHPYSWCT